MLKVKDGVGRKWEYKVTDDFIDYLYSLDCVMQPVVDHMRHTGNIFNARELIPYLEEVCEDKEELRFLEDVKGFDDYKSLYFERVYVKFGYEARVLGFDGDYAIVMKKKGKYWSDEDTYRVPLSDKAKSILPYIDTSDDNWVAINVTQDDLYIVTYVWNNRLEMVNDW